MKNFAWTVLVSLGRDSTAELEYPKIVSQRRGQDARVSAAPTHPGEVVRYPHEPV